MRLKCSDMMYEREKSIIITTILIQKQDVSVIRGPICTFVTVFGQCVIFTKIIKYSFPVFWFCPLTILLVQIFH